MNDRHKAIILAMADCDLQISKTARKLYCNRNTIIYHLQKIKVETGLDPEKFWDLCKLVEIAREEK